MEYYGEKSHKRQPIKDDGSDDTPSEAYPLDIGTSRRQGIDVWAELKDERDVDYYRVATPSESSSFARTMVIQLRNLDAKKVRPRLAVFDEAMNPLPYEIISNERSNKLTVQVTGVKRDSVYFVRVAGDGDKEAKGDYRLGVDFAKVGESSLSQLQTGMLGGELTGVGGVLELTSTAVFRFVLNALPVSGGAEGMTVTLTVTGADGKDEYLSLTQTPGEGPVDGAVYLPAGRYTVRIEASAEKDCTVAGLYFSLFGGLLSDPIGPSSTTTTTDPADGSTTCYYSPDPSTVTWTAVDDPYSSPWWGF